ncbi:hypothetical protein [Leucobacter salsicius]|uniref:hypothetical protein n=1 Tax=Leucobacter salsicius TaxID=664638 RepID=UPI0012F89E27|nr:hypothetical protein [Leucobacter salsicius]
MSERPIMSTETRHECHPEFAAYDTEAEAKAAIVEGLSEQADSFGIDLADSDISPDDVVAAAWDLDPLYAEAISELDCDCRNEYDPDADPVHGSFYGILTSNFHEVESRHFSHTPTVEELI